MKSILINLNSSSPLIEINSDGTTTTTPKEAFEVVQDEIESSHVELTLVGESKTVTLYVKEGYRKELLFLSKLRVIYGKLYSSLDSEKPVG